MLLALASGLQMSPMKASPVRLAGLEMPKGFAAASAAVTAATTNMVANAGGQSEGTGLIFGIDDNRELLVLGVIFFGFFTLYNGWASGQPDSDSDFFGEYDERRS